MTFLGLLFIGLSFYLGFRIKKDAFERTNQYGVQEYNSFGNKIANDAKKGVFTLLSVIVGLIGFGMLMWGIFV